MDGVCGPEHEQRLRGVVLGDALHDVSVEQGVLEHAGGRVHGLPWEGVRACVCVRACVYVRVCVRVRLLPG